MIRVALSAIVAGLLCMLAAQARSAELVLAENGQSAYRIVVATGRLALGQTWGRGVAIVPRADQRRQAADRFRPAAAGPKEIILGDNAHLRKLRRGDRFCLPRQRRLRASHRRRHAADCRRAGAGRDVRRLWSFGRSPGLPLVRPGRKPHSQVGPSGDRSPRRPPGSRARIARAVRGRFRSRSRLECAEPDELEQLVARRAAWRQSEVWRRLLRPHV